MHKIIVSHNERYSNVILSHIICFTLKGAQFMRFD